MENKNVKIKLTRKLLVEQMEISKNAITKHLGVVDFCQNLLVNSEFPEDNKEAEKTKEK